MNQINNSLFKRMNNEISINSPQRKILDSIIAFYYENGNSDFDEKIQIMNLIKILTPNFSMIQVDNDIKDPLYYIQEQKKCIKFVNINFKLFNVLVPKSISKNDLYSIGLFYKTLHNSNILLVYHNNILKKDESSIDNIQNEDIITIIEDVPFPDDTYYNNLLQYNKNEEILDIYFQEEGDRNSNSILKFPKNITVDELQKAIYLKFGYNKSNLILYDYKHHPLNSHLYKKVYELFAQKIFFKIAGDGLLSPYIQRFGKDICVKVIDKKTQKSTLSTYIGLLNSNKDLIKYIEINLDIKIKKMYLNKKEVNINEIRSLSSLGITHNCDCVIDY